MDPRAIYLCELQRVVSRDADSVYAVGLKRGFLGETAVCDEEHSRLNECRRNGNFYRNGLLRGQHLKAAHDFRQLH